MERIDLSRLDPPPSGFGNCGDCPYRDVGTAPICFTCASATMEPVSPTRCLICDQRLPESGADCPNPVCNWDTRHFDMVWAIAMRSGELERAIDL